MTYWAALAAKNKKKLTVDRTIDMLQFRLRGYIFFYFCDIFGFHTSSTSSISTNSIVSSSRAAPPIPITDMSSRITPAVNTRGAL